VDFKEWLILQERREVDPATLQGVEQGFRRALDQLIARTNDPVLRAEFQKMRTCPIRDSQGRCRDFTDYVLGTFLRHGCYGIDLDDAMQHAFFQLVSPRNMKGQSKVTVFDFDETRPYNSGDNPLEARIKTSVGRLARTVCGGQIRKLRTLQRPSGTISIGQGEAGLASPNEIADRSDPARELMQDILTLLHKREKRQPDLALVDLFQSMLRGESIKQQRATFGRQATDLGKRIVKDVIRQYAQDTDNYRLLSLIEGKPRSKPKPTPKPKLPPDEQDYRSIVSVLERNSRQANLAMLGSKRRRWLERPPRNPSSPHPHRLADVLARMVADGVLEEKKTKAGGRYFVPGPRYGEYAGS